MTWPDGTRYEGQFVKGKMEGRGVKTWPNGNSFDGMFKDNLQHGQGEHHHVQTNEYEKQEWREGKRWNFNK